MDIYRKNKQFYLGLRHIGGGGRENRNGKRTTRFLCNHEATILNEFCKEIKGTGGYSTLDECIDECMKLKRYHTEIDEINTKINEIYPKINKINTEINKINTEIDDIDKINTEIDEKFIVDELIDVIPLMNKLNIRTSHQDNNYFIYFKEISLRLTHENKKFIHVYSGHPPIMVIGKLYDLTIMKNINQDLMGFLKKVLKIMKIDNIDIYIQKYKDTQQKIEDIKKIPSLNLTQITNNTDICMTIMMGEYGITESTHTRPIISTYGMGPCHGILIYNTLLRKAGLSHISNQTIITTLDNMFAGVITDTDSKNIKIYVVGGNGNYDLTVKIFDYIAMKKLKDCIVGTALHDNNNGKIGLDTRTGKTGIYNCSLMKDMDNPYIPMRIPLFRSRFSL